jgi:hypothetical protein
MADRPPRPCWPAVDDDDERTAQTPRQAGRRHAGVLAHLLLLLVYALIFGLPLVAAAWCSSGGRP